MGVASLAPEVFRKTFGVKIGLLDLHVLDSTRPEAVLDVTKKLEPAKTLFIVSTKSGGTVETFSFMKHFYNQTLQTVGPDNVGRHFIAITDPGSGLETMAKELNFRKTFLNDPKIGGRYSALSYFGLVPAGLIGVDLQKLLNRAQTMVCNSEGCNCPVDGDNTAAQLGAVIGQLAQQGRDKLTLLTSPQLESFGAWAEQLIAESTGKEGAGIVPVTGEAVLSPEHYADDRLFVYLKRANDATLDAQVDALRAAHPLIDIVLKDEYDLGGEFFRWEMATAIAGAVLAINPFDQPNVEAAKILARKMVAAYEEKGSLPKVQPSFSVDNVAVFTDEKTTDLKQACQHFLTPLQNGKRSYAAIQAFVPPTAEAAAALQELRSVIQQKYKMATTLGLVRVFCIPPVNCTKAMPETVCLFKLLRIMRKIRRYRKTPAATPRPSVLAFSHWHNRWEIGKRSSMPKETSFVFTFVTIFWPGSKP
mgnify:CR=1 FL=1